MDAITREFEQLMCDLAARAAGRLELVEKELRNLERTLLRFVPIGARHATSRMRIVVATLLAFLSPVLARADCPADLNGDQVVNGSDLAVVLSGWGSNSGDLTGDGNTDGSDLANLLSTWGDCPAPIDWTLLTTTNGTVTNAIDSTGAVVKSWTGAAGGTSVAYLRADGSLVRPTVHTAGAFNGPVRGGRIQIFSPTGVLTHDLLVSNSTFQQHHDVRPMPNGNILCIVWDGHTMADAQAAGRQTITTAFWPDSILEIKPTGTTTYDIVWRWNLWDHLIQDVNPALANYGVVADHPELIDINLGMVSGGDWTHCNSIDYDPVRDEILISSRTLSEVFVIDHSTTTAQAASHSGGARGRGGDILYRWGNPGNYDRSTSSNRYLYVVHSATWIREGMPGAGNILMFNNGDRSGTANDYSSVFEIVPPRDPKGNYTISAASAFGPSAPVWTYGGVNQIYGGPTQCGAFRTLDNTTLITLTNSARTFEVNAAGAVIWNRINTGLTIARAPRYRQVNGLWVGP